MRKSTLQMMAFAIVLMLISQIPLFVLASEVDADEWAKFGSAIVLGVLALLTIIAREAWKYIGLDPAIKQQLERAGKKKPGSFIVDDTLKEDDIDSMAE